MGGGGAALWVRRLRLRDLALSGRRSSKAKACFEANSVSWSLAPSSVLLYERSPANHRNACSGVRTPPS